MFGTRTLGSVCLGAVLGVVILASPSLAANLVEVRVGRHPEFTRVVFELDDQAKYAIQTPMPGVSPPELVIEIGADSRRRVITSHSNLVEAVRVEPGGAGSTVARILLRGGRVDVVDMMLTHPPRIVVDLREGARPAAEPVETVETVTAPTPAPPAVEPEPPVAIEDAPDAQPPAASVPDPGAARHEPGEPDLDVAPEYDAEPEAAASDPGAEEDAWWEPPAAEPQAAVESAPEAAARPAPGVVPARAQPATGRGNGGSLLARIPGGGGVLIAVSVLAIALLLLLWARLRRGSGQETFDPVGPGEEGSEAELVVEARDEGPLAETAVPTAQEFEPESDPVAPAREVFAATGAGEPQRREEISMDPAVERTMADAATGITTQAGVDPLETERRLEELERRLGQLEKRLEEVVDAKERLERHVAAQTEELRVQRAAIARTQRVLRGLTRPDDQATEPAMKTPNS